MDDAWKDRLKQALDKLHINRVNLPLVKKLKFLKNLAILGIDGMYTKWVFN